MPISDCFILFFSTIQTKICQPHSGVVSFAPWQEPESATISIWADYDKEYISVSLGKLCAVASINDKGFAKKLLSLAGEKNGEECNLC